MHSSEKRKGAAMASIFLCDGIKLVSARSVNVRDEKNSNRGLLGRHSLVLLAGLDRRAFGTRSHLESASRIGADAEQP